MERGPQIEALAACLCGLPRLRSLPTSSSGHTAPRQTWLTVKAFLQDAMQASEAGDDTRIGVSGQETVKVSFCRSCLRAW